MDRPAIRDYLASQTIETVLGQYSVNDKGQQAGYRYVATQWQSGVSKVVGGVSTTPAEWPKPKWS